MGQLFSKRNKEVFSAPLGIDNPVTVQVLGICSALAVTAKLEPAIVMGLSVTVITAFANVVISLLRKTIPNRIRIIVQLVVVAALVTIVSEVLKAFAYDVSVQLSVYVGLIITNCILMGRLEAFAMQNGPWESFLDGVGNGLGYAKILVIVAFFRELLGSGTLLGFNILNYEPIQNIGYVNNGLMLMPPMALIIGQNQMMSARYFKYSKDRSMITSGGLGTMGFGLPAAIGATFGRPDRTVCVFMGDGGLQMNIQELGTIMEQKAPVKIIVLNNNFLGNVRQWQAMFFNRKYSFTPMLNPDYIKIASAYDIPAKRVFTREELADAIDEMIATDGPFLLEACVIEEGNVLPMTPPGGSVNQMLLEC